MERLTKRMGGISYSMCDNVIIAKCENCTHRQPSCYDEDCQAELDVTARLAAYEDTDTTPEQVARFRWIPVSDRLPEESDGDENGEVLIYKGGEKWITKVRWVKDEGATHWMYLPELPKEE